MDLLNLLKDKTAVLAALTKAILDAEKTSITLSKISDSVSRAEEPNRTSENMAACITALSKIIEKQNHTINQLCVVGLITASSNSFDTDVAMILNKMGKGNEALQQIFKNKMGGF